MPITMQHSQECLSLAYIYALAGMAGVNISIDRVYDYGVDGTLLPVTGGARRVETGFKLDFQLKSTTRWQHDGEHVVYDLEAKTYNDLVGRDPAAVRCILILLCLPAEQAEWLGASETELLLRRCCYWTAIVGGPTENVATKTIRIPRTSLLTAESVHAALAAERARRLEV